MRLLRLLSNFVGLGRTEDSIPVEFNEMVLIIRPSCRAVLYTKPGSNLTVSGYAGALWIWSDQNATGYMVRHGQTVHLPFHGKIVIESKADHVPGRLHIVYEPAKAFSNWI
jgi:hypothetical protein